MLALFDRLGLAHHHAKDFQMTTQDGSILTAIENVEHFFLDHDHAEFFDESGLPISKLDAIIRVGGSTETATIFDRSFKWTVTS